MVESALVPARGLGRCVHSFGRMTPRRCDGDCGVGAVQATGCHLALIGHRYPNEGISNRFQWVHMPCVALWALHTSPSLFLHCPSCFCTSSNPHTRCDLQPDLLHTCHAASDHMTCCMQPWPASHWEHQLAASG